MDWVNTLFTKLTKYEWLNILIPGMIAVIVGRVIGCNMMKASNWAEFIALYAFWGVIASRIGALLVEPVCKMWGLVKFAPYGDYLRYEKAEPERCGELMATGNFFRTMSGLGILLLILRARMFVGMCVGADECVHLGWYDCALILWILMFVLSYIRQIKFIVNRVKAFVSDNTVD